jgi:16S rRNA C1402 (ribose-2'-O) methylase RsmI
MGSVIFGCIDIGNKDDISKTFFDYLHKSDAVVVENKYMWDEFCLNNQIEYSKEILSINLPGLKGKFL